MSHHKITLDVGGEGRHVNAWNLNPSRIKTIGPDRGAPIPRLILGRADSIPLPDGSVDLVIVERTPLSAAGIQEISRITSVRGTVILRHAVPPNVDPHRVAQLRFAACKMERRVIHRSGYWLQETVFAFKR